VSCSGRKASAARENKCVIHAVFGIVLLSADTADAAMASRGLRGSSANAGSTSTACRSDVFTLSNLLRMKPVQDVLRERTTEEKSDPEGTSLKKALGIPDLLGYGVGCTVGENVRNGTDALLWSRIMHRRCWNILADWTWRQSCRYASLLVDIVAGYYMRNSRQAKCRINAAQ